MDTEPTPTKPKRPPQLKRLRPKQVAYAEALAQGLSQGAAAKKAGYSHKSAAYKAHKNPQVQQYLSDIQRSAAARVGYTVAVAMDEAAQDHDFALKTGNANAAVNATTLRCKLSGHLRDTIEIVSMDLKGALEQARTRVIQVNPAYKQLLEAQTQDNVDPVG